METLNNNNNSDNSEIKLLANRLDIHRYSEVPKYYVQPQESRPDKVMVKNDSIPIINLGGHDRAHIINQLLKASQEYGLFQVINHGVSKKLMDETLNVFKEFHAMPAEEKKIQCSKDPDGKFKIYTKNMNYWPDKPHKYREIVGEYTRELHALAHKILELLGEGLGVAPKYIYNKMGEDPTIVAQHYPACPDPSVTLGIPKHRDPSLVTILLQEEQVQGLHLEKDGQWIAVDPIPNAFVVNIGFILQLMTNGKVVGGIHRAVTNSKTARTSVVYLIYPSPKAIIKPAEEFVNEKTPTLGKFMNFEDFHAYYVKNGMKIEEEYFKIKP
ncbi:Hyoscyamine 6-dioxygenase [Arachis hypogaea]|nr:Hyoscyamine 6-dioxygenase [Arachis hypogaea]